MGAAQKEGTKGRRESERQMGEGYTDVLVLVLLLVVGVCMYVCACGSYTRIAVIVV